MIERMASKPESAPDDLVELGRIEGSYGVRGWVKVEPFNARSDVLLHASRWWIRQGSDAALVPHQVIQSRPQGSTVVAEIRGLSTREQAAAWKGARVLVARSAFPAPDDDEYYWVDLIGCQVMGEEDDGTSVCLGRVTEVADNGAHAILYVLRTDAQGAMLPDARGREQIVLVPFVAAHVLEVDLPGRRIVSNWPLDV